MAGTGMDFFTSQRLPASAYIECETDKKLYQLYQSMKSTNIRCSNPARGLLLGAVESTAVTPHEAVHDYLRLVLKEKM